MASRRHRRFARTCSSRLVVRSNAPVPALGDSPPATAPRAIAYRRCSTSEQVESALGLDAQQAAIAQAAARLGLTLVGDFTDAGLSGGLPLEARPALLAALDRLQTGDTLVVNKRDRLGRDVLNVAMMERLVASDLVDGRVNAD